MSFAGVVGGRADAAEGVLALGDGVEVRGSDAGPVSAEVIEVQSLLDRPDEDVPREAVGFEHVALVRGLAVAGGITRPQPRPAFAGELVVRLDEDPGPESRREARVALIQVEQMAPLPLADLPGGRLHGGQRPHLELVDDTLTRHAGQVSSGDMGVPPLNVTRLSCPNDGIPNLLGRRIPAL